MAKAYLARAFNWELWAVIQAHTASRFKTTCWTLILSARDNRESMSDLLSRYWSPIYAYLRRDGCDPEKAEELTQAFVADVMLGRELLVKANPTRGRFRSYLLKSLKNYVIDVHRHEFGRDQKREFLSLSDEVKAINHYEPIESDDPDQAFMRQWATAVFDQALTQMRETCEHDGMETHWIIFEARSVRPLLHGSAPAEIEDLIHSTGASGPDQISNILHSAKRKFFAILCGIIAETVESPDEIDTELDELIKVLGTQ